MLNQFNVIGHVGRDPETKTSASGTTFTNFSVAVNSGYGDKKETMWVNVTTFGKTAEFVGQYIKKGALVYVSGELKIEEYTNKENVKVSSPKLTANTVKSLSRSEGSSDNAAPAEKEATTKSAGVSPADIPW